LFFVAKKESLYLSMLYLMIAKLSGLGNIYRGF